MPPQPDVEHQAVELRMLLVREERFGGRVADRLKARQTQQPAQRGAKAALIVNDRDVNVARCAHPICWAD